jgi:hypothetical protein
LVLVKGRANAEARKNASEIASAVRAVQVAQEVLAVFAHEDADALEPAHDSLATEIEQRLGAALGLPIVAVVPAWEREAWWFLWPQAVSAVNSKWAPLKRRGQVGKIPDAKEALISDLRPKTKGQRPRDYEESDAPRIAAKVRELGVVEEIKALSASWTRFRDRVAAL